MNGDSGARGGLGELLLHHRLTARLSQRELSKRSGLSERAVRDLERGVVATPRRQSLRALATALGLSGDDAVAFVAAFRPETARQAPAKTLRPRPGDMVGRRAELRALADLVTGSRHRLVTVTGPAGVGKSRLIAALVSIVRSQTQLPVYALDLSGLASPELLGEMIAEAAGPPGARRAAPVERVAAELRQRRAVLALDCFERLFQAAPVLAELVRRCPGLTIVTGSRRPLNLTGERLVQLGPLPMGDAVELFTRRAVAAAPGFTPSPQDEEAVRAICGAVEGLPLAIELAAARMRLLTPAELAARLDRPLHLLTGGRQDAPERHRSLRAAIQSSLDLVGDQAGTLLNWLAPFAGGVRLADLEHVVSRVAGDCGWLIGALTELVDAGLVRVRDSAAGSRFVLPDAMRQLAAERLAAEAEDAVVRRAAALWYLERLRSVLSTVDGDGYADLESELDNLRASVQWARLHQPGVLDSATVQALYRFHELRGRYREGLTTLIKLADTGVPGAATALVAAASLSRLLKDPAGAESLASRAETLAAEARHGTRPAA